MRKTVLLAGVLWLALIFGAGPVSAVDVGELERRIDILSDELDSMKESGGVGDHAFGPDRVKLHGYGELHLNHRPQGGKTELDMHRFVIGIHAMLADWIHLNAEIDFEHAAQELEFEFGYLDFLLTQGFNARAGVVLIPVGFLNEFHEPPLFWTVERPEFHSKIIPTTWGAGGVGIFGTPMEGVNYRLYFVNAVQSIRPVGFGSGAGAGAGGNSGEFKGSSGIRSGRLQVNEAIAEDFAVVGRVELTQLFPGFQFGFSFYTGDTTHNIIEEDGNILLLEADIKYRWQWFEMNASIANIDIDDAAAINTFCAGPGGSCTADVAENIFGWNIQGGVHLFQLLNVDTTHDLIPFILYEEIRPQDEMPSGTAPTASNNFEVVTIGVSYMPIPAVALKADYQQFFTGASTSRDQFNLGVAFMYD